MAFVSRNDFQSALQQARVQPVQPCNAADIFAASQPPPQEAARPAVAKKLCTPSVAEYRGTSAAANVKPTRNLSSDPGHTSLPMREVKQAMNTRRQPNDITAHQTNALLTGFGSVFGKDSVKTGKGWKPGKF